MDRVFRPLLEVAKAPARCVVHTPPAGSPFMALARTHGLLHPLVCCNPGRDGTGGGEVDLGGGSFHGHFLSVRLAAPPALPDRCRRYVAAHRVQLVWRYAASHLT